LRTLRKAWYHPENPLIAQTKADMQSGWSEFADDLETLAQK